MDNRFNTISGWVLFSGIIALGFSIVSGMYFHADHPERPENLGYVVEVDGDAGGDSGPTLAELLATGSAEAGEAVFAKCTACHTINQGGPAGIGPNLHGVLGTKIGHHAPGFAYSSALSEHGGQWNWENVDAWLTSPRAFANGTKMSFAGLSKPEDRANLMLFLNANGGTLTKPAVEEKAEEAADDAAAEGAIEGAEAEGEAQAEDAATAGAEQDAAAKTDT